MIFIRDSDIKDFQYFYETFYISTLAPWIDIHVIQRSIFMYWTLKSTHFMNAKIIYLRTECDVPIFLEE